MLPMQITMTPTGVPTTSSVATGQASTTALTLSATPVSFSPARRITFTSTGSLATVTFAIVGTDRYGTRQTESLLPTVTTGTTTSVKNWASVSQITLNTVTEIVNVGSGTAASQAIPLNYLADPFAVSLLVNLTTGASLTYEIQHTADNIRTATGWNGEEQGTATQPSTWFVHPTLTGQTARADGNYSFPITAARINITSLTTGGVVWQVVQAGV